MKNEAYRLSGKGKPHGTLRWQAPELMSGNIRLTAEMDVYAFAIVCVEILTMGKMPWPLSDDEAVRRFVLQDNTRPTLPATRFNTPALQDLLRRCWARDPKDRPPFAIIVQELKALRKTTGLNVEEVASPRLPGLQELAEEDHYPLHASPDMRPGPLPSLSDFDGHWAVNPPVTREHSEDLVANNDAPGMPVPAVYTSSTETSRSSTINSMPESPKEGEEHHRLGLQRWQSPVPHDERMAMQRNERRYRLLLEHPFHQSLTLPLWSPTSVELGAVGYLSKPEGSFVTLFNAFSPHVASHPGVRTLPSVYGYGTVKKGSQKVDRRTLAQRGVDKIAGWLTFKKQGDVTSHNVSRRVSFPLKAGHKVAVLYTELTDYRYVESLDAPKRWFKAHVDPVMQIFGAMHQIQKEDLFLVIGTLQSPNYALFVSHSHPDGHAHFNVFTSPKKDQRWGSFTTDSLVQEDTGPSYTDRADATRVCASKISNNAGVWDSVLLARLRFKPDILEPTSI
ncbi:hypothetical protein BDQ17DRAFT_1441497 [Cyathus striatus]|nr:hypothetical protein BDQ17DRAFT_1441497 [Cyathus striatus]